MHMRDMPIQVARRARKEPVQYILGEWDFYNLRNIRVRKPTVSRMYVYCRRADFLQSHTSILGETYFSMSIF